LTRYDGTLVALLLTSTCLWLTSWRDSARVRPQAGAVQHVVEAQLEQDEQVLTGPALLPVGLLVVAAELLLEHAVVVAGLLLLAELEQVLRLLDAAAAVLTRRVGALLEVLVVALEVHAERRDFLVIGPV
jgi:hypothetical protein